MSTSEKEQLKYISSVLKEQEVNILKLDIKIKELIKLIENLKKENKS